MKYLKAKAMFLSALITLGTFAFSNGPGYSVEDGIGNSVVEKSIKATALGQSPEVSSALEWTPPELHNSEWADEEVYDARVYGLITYDISRNIQEEMNRADAAEIGVRLYERLLGKRMSGEISDPFSDTDDRYVLKAYNLGIVKGRGNGVYDPDSTITREDLAVIMYNAIGKANPALSKGSLISSFEDGEKVSDYARLPVEYMLSHKIIKGRTPARIYPQANTTKEESLIIAKRIYERINDLYEKSSKGLFYKVSNGNTEVHILGSIHMVTEDAYPIDSDVREIFKNSNTLAVEVDIINETELSDEIMEKAIYPDGQSLKDDISPELYKEISELLEQHSIWSIESIKEFRPWYLNMVLPFLTGLEDLDEESWGDHIDYDNLTPDELEDIENLPYRYTPGIDEYFLEKTSTNGISIEELEGPEYQINMLSGMSMETQEEILQKTVRQLVSGETGRSTLADIIKHWKAADEDSFASLIEDSKAGMPEEYNTALWDVRNKEMSDKIEAYLESGSQGNFVLVGAGHLVGETSIINDLKSRGYEVEMIK